jgi:AcrR family transcriptional regulator
VTKPILYRHFDSKRALYLALLERHRDDLGRFAGLIPAEGRVEERLRSAP